MIVLFGQDYDSHFSLLSKATKRTHETYKKQKLYYLYYYELRLVFILDSPAYYRVPRMIQKVAGILVSWQIVDDVFDKCDEQNRQLISKAVSLCLFMLLLVISIVLKYPLQTFLFHFLNIKNKKHTSLFFFKF